MTNPGQCSNHVGARTCPGTLGSATTTGNARPKKCHAPLPGKVATPEKFPKGVGWRLSDRRFQMTGVGRFSARMTPFFGGYNIVTIPECFTVPVFQCSDMLVFFSPGYAASSLPAGDVQRGDADDELVRHF